MKKLLTKLFLVSVGLGLFTACEKDEQIYELTVIVTVDGEDRVQNALVHTYAPVTNAFLDYYSYTNDEGEIFLKLDNKAVVEIVAAKGSFRACGFAEINRGENTATIDLKPFGDEENGCVAN